MKANTIALLVVATIGFLGVARAAELSYIDRSLLIEYEVIGRDRAALIVAAEPQRTEAVARAIEALGGQLVAGLGRSPVEPDPDRYDLRNAHCDVLVVGAGVSGIRSHEGPRAGLVCPPAEFTGDVGVPVHLRAFK